MKRTPVVLDVMAPAWEVASEYKTMPSNKKISLLVLNQIFPVHSLIYNFKSLPLVDLERAKYNKQGFSKCYEILLSSNVTCIVNFLAIFKHFQITTHRQYTVFLVQIMFMHKTKNLMPFATGSFQ